MGIKLLKEKFGIKHIVCRDGENICIGSSYVTDLITISPSGKVSKHSWISDNDSDEIGRLYSRLKNCDELVQIMNTPDLFGTLTDVWTEKNGHVVKKQCEKTGWPNITTDGIIMYNNEFFHGQYARARALDCARFHEWFVLKLQISSLVSEIRRRIPIISIRFIRFCRAWVFFGM